MEKNDVLFNVLFIDDEWDKQEDFMNLSKKKYKIELFPIKVRLEGIRMYNEDPQKWDAVIIDAKCYYKSENESASKEGLRKTQDTFSKYFDLPTFIYTGQPDYVGNEDFRADYEDYYEKPDDQEKLLEDIIQAIKDKPNRAIKNKYKDIFDWYPNHTELLKILSYVEENKNNNSEVFTMIRKELEKIMRELEDKGLLPKLFFNGTNTKNCSRFLGNDQLIKYVPSYIKRVLHSCTEIANNISHASEEDKDVSIGNAPYLIRSTVFEFLNILYWFHSLPNDDSEMTRDVMEALKDFKCNPDVGPGLQYEPKRDEDGNLHIGNCVLPYLDGKTIKKCKVIKIEDNTNNRTKDKYPYFANIDIV